MNGTSTGLRAADLTEDELQWLHMGPFDGGVAGLVRRIRRILDVSQRGLAELLEVSQSVVARWETERTSPRVSVLQEMLRLAGITVALHDEESGEEVVPMRADGARKRISSTEVERTIGEQFARILHESRGVNPALFCI